MTLKELTYKNISYFKSYYRLVAVAVVITVAVIVGSLMVGDSVRSTLVNRVKERLGDTETIIFSRNSFIDESITKDSRLGASARTVLLTNGFISQSGKLIPVVVWGVNDMDIAEGKAKVNTALLKELETNETESLVLRLPSTGLVPSGSLFVSENYTTSMRLALDGTVSVEEGGNISMKNEQTIPLNIFVNRAELAVLMEIEGKVNVILSNERISDENFKKVWSYPMSGLSVRNKNGYAEISSDRVFLQNDVVNLLINNTREPNRLFSYLANSIEHGTDSIPYSFVTAIDSYKGTALNKNELILSDYSAKRLNVSIGDTVRVSYFRSDDFKTLKTKAVSLHVKEIVPIADLLTDSTLSADFPGLSDVDKCTDWDSDLPINMNLIKDEDEEYWNLYKSTPKALIAYNAVAPDWSNAYGTATAVRVADTIPDLSQLSPEMFGIQLIYPKEAGIYAAKNSVDFSSLFLSLGIFIIISSLILMQIPFAEMIYQRRKEIELLRAVGYTKQGITKMLWSEAAPIVLISSIVGVLAGIVYTTVVMWLLGSLWKGATHTDVFSIYPKLTTIVLGMLVGIMLSMWMLRKTIVKNLRDKKHKVGHRKLSLKAKRNLSVLASLITLATLVINSIFIQSSTGFVIAGIVLLATATLWGDYIVCRNASSPANKLKTNSLVWKTLAANKKQALSSFISLAIGVFIVFAVGLNRKGFADSSQLLEGTGGYSLWCESSVPIFHNMTTETGREKLALSELPPNTELLQCMRMSADEASCLNLNKVSMPTVLGVDMNDLKNSKFQISQNLYAADRDKVFEKMQKSTDHVYPALVDATVLTWSLGMQLGDTIFYENDAGRKVAIQLVGTLSNSIFQGNILIDRKLFSEIWTETKGSEVFLLKIKELEKENVKNLLSQALNEYGVRVTPTNERLKQFNSVTDTYLSIFMTLGGLGLLLGIMSLIIVIRKTLITRKKEIKMYEILGFNNNKIYSILYKENIIVPMYAIACGLISSLLGVSISYTNIGIRIWLMALLLAIFFIGCVLLFVRRLVGKTVNKRFKLVRRINERHCEEPATK
ncbi:MAG: FtsX-like permease family protein [Bacteroidales bacterium]